ncbi:MAG: hypothetical protein AAGF07_02055 [Patescibacteria group bacterium]
MQEVGNNKVFKRKHLVLILILGIISVLFLTNNILYWLVGITLTQVYILSSNRIKSLFKRKISNKVVRSSVQSALGFIICLSFFSLTESLSPAIINDNNGVVAGITNSRNPRIDSENEIASTVENQVTTQTEKVSNVPTPNLNKNKEVQPTQPVNTAIIEDTSTISKSTQLNNQVNQSRKNEIKTSNSTKQVSSKSKLINNKVDYKTKLTYDKNGDGRVNCKDFSKNIKDKKILYIFPGLDPDQNGIGCE